MKLSDVRFVKGLLVGLLSRTEDVAWLSVALALCAIAYLVAAALTKDPPHPAAGAPNE